MTARPRVGLACAYDLSVPGGVQAQVLGLARELGARGWPVSVLAPGVPVPVETGDGGTALSHSAGRVLAVAANGSVARVAAAPARRSVSAWAAACDLVHLHEPLAPGLPQALLRRAAVPVVATVHARTDARLLRLAAPVLRARLRRCAAVTAVSEHAADTLRRHLGIDPGIVGNGVDVPPVPPPPPGGPPVVVAVGRLAEPRKGVDVLLAAWPRVRGAHPRARLLLVGGGRPRGLPRGGPPAGVQVLGRVDDATRTALLDAAHVVVAPHRGGESFGLVVAEAMARGRPVVASTLPAFGDLLGPAPDGPAAGVLVPVGDPAALAAAVARLLGDPARREALGGAGHDRVARWSWPRIVPAWEAVYRAALPAGPPAPPTMGP